MDIAAIYCLGVPLLLFLILLGIGLLIYRPSNRDKGEEPKYRMLHDD
jgi:cbb3-type cytochrome oxidase subunit 3